LSVRRLHSLPLMLTAVLAVTIIGRASGHPSVFLPGQVFCPSRTLAVGTIVMQPQQCFSIFLMRTPQTTFLGFVPAGLIAISSRQVINLGTALGTQIKSRTALLLPLVVPGLFVPVNSIVVQPFQIEEMGGTIMGVRLADAPNIVVPFPTQTPTTAAPLFPTSFEIPLPADLRIIPPGSDVPSDEAVFSGKWAGRWNSQDHGVADDGLPHIFVVESIRRENGFMRSERRIIGIFAWGESSRWEVFPGWTRGEGVFERGILQFTLPGGVRATYRMVIDDTLEGTYESPDFGVLLATLSRTR
jgi:hypothetical protein